MFSGSRTRLDEMKFRWAWALKWTLNSFVYEPRRLRLKIPQKKFDAKQDQEAIKLNFYCLFLDFFMGKVFFSLLRLECQRWKLVRAITISKSSFYLQELNWQMIKNTLTCKCGVFQNNIFGDDTNLVLLNHKQLV